MKKIFRKFGKSLKRINIFTLVIVIFALISILIFLGYRMKLSGGSNEENEEIDFIEQRNEINIIKEKVGYVPPTKEEIENQIDELRELREKAKETQ